MDDTIEETPAGGSGQTQRRARVRTSNSGSGSASQKSIEVSRVMKLSLTLNLWHDQLILAGSGRSRPSSQSDVNKVGASWEISMEFFFK